MAFPQNPTIGDLYTYGGKTFRWDGASWSKIFGGISSDFYPTVNEGFSLGTASNKWGNLHLSGNTIYLGQTKLESSGDGSLSIKSTNAEVTTSISLSSNGYIAAPSGPLSTASGAVSASPRISNVQIADSSYNVLDDTAADSGGYVIVNGANFDNGATVVIGNTTANSVTFINSSVLNVALPSLSTGTYAVYVVNSNGETATRINGLSISGFPTWQNPAGSLGSAYESFPFSATLNATSDTAVVYSLYSGSLPTGTGANLNAGNGNIYVAVNDLTNSNTTFNFTINATDTQLQNTTRAFSATVLTDEVRWVSSNVDEIILASNSSVFSYTLNAISLSGRTLTYAANSLPDGITLTGNVISGTFSSLANTLTIATANTSTTNKSNSYSLCFVVYQEQFPIQYLVVAGGGGGGQTAGGAGSGGGGAGGYYCNYISSGFCTGLFFPLSIGAGGNQNSNGSNSCFGGNTSIPSCVVTGGGKGGVGCSTGGGPGGSGGGGGAREIVGCQGYSAGSGTPGQGNPGGSGWHVSSTIKLEGGGGGGAASAGTSADSSCYPSGVKPNGGDGCLTSITGAPLYFAGGGGGGGYYNYTKVGAGGLGGGGGGGGNNPGTCGGGCAINPGSAGTTSSGVAPGGNAGANTGGGGGGAGGSSVSSGGKGGSGIVVLSIPSSRTATFSAGITATEANTSVPGVKIYCVTAGAGTVCFS